MFDLDSVFFDLDVAERDVAFSLLHSLNGAGSNTKVIKDCFRTGGHRRLPSPTRGTYTYSRPRTAGVRTKPAHLTAPHIEQRYLNVMGKSMDRTMDRTMER